MRLGPITGWQAHIEAGRQYLRTAVNGQRRPAVFNNELIFQLAAMAVEKLVAGLIQYHRQMPFDHTLSGLAADLAEVCPLDATLAARIRAIETVDDMCALTARHRQPPANGAIEEILAVGRDIERFVDGHLPAGGGKPASV